MGLFLTNYQHNIYLNMLQHSSNNSSRSNLFALSSQSSRSDLKRVKGEKYTSFVKKVKHLLEIESDDLDDVYRKIEIIVRKYFDEHKIVEFGDMYNHIEALKSNSSKMSKIVGILQRKLLAEQHPKQKIISQSRKTEKNEVLTLSTRNQNETKGRRLETELNKSQVNQINQINQINQNYNMFAENQDTVVSSIKYNHIYRPSFRAKTQISVSEQKNDSAQSVKTKGDDTVSVSYSPGKEYKQRNRQYEDQVRELMEEVKAIKQSLKEQQLSQPSQTIQSHQLSQSHHSIQSKKSIQSKQSIQSSQQVELRQNKTINQQSQNNSQSQQFNNTVEVKKKPSIDIKEQLKIKLQQNNEQRSQIKSQQSIIDGLQSNLMKQTTQTTQTNQTEQAEPKREAARKSSLAAIIELSKENVQSSKTIGSEKRIQDVRIAENKIESIFKILDESQSVEQKKQVLRKKAQFITQQLRELKQVASNLQMQTPPQSANAVEQQKTVFSSTNIIFTNNQPGNNQILENISDTTSKQVIEPTPSPPFIRIEEQSDTGQSAKLIQSKQSVRMIESSNFSFSGSRHQIDVTNIPHIQPLMTNSQYISMQPRNISFTSNNSYTYASQKPQQAQPSAVRYIYNPYQHNNNTIVSPISTPNYSNQTIYLPAQHQQTFNVNNMNNLSNMNNLNNSHRQIINSSYQLPLSSNSSTSIMNQRNMQQTSVNRSSVQKIQVLAARNDNIILNQPNSPPYARFTQSMVNPIYSNQSINSSSSSVSKRKGINLLSPPARQTFQP